MGFKIKKTVNGETVWEPIKAKKYTASKTIEYTGALPITINANGQPLLEYRIYGNTEQTGTPTPENPIMPIGCGERTENIMDVYSANGNKVVYYSGVTFNFSEEPQCITVNGQSTAMYPQVQIWGKNGVLHFENGKTYTALIRTTNKPKNSNIYMLIQGCDAEGNWSTVKYVYSDTGGILFSVSKDYVNFRNILVCQNPDITYDNTKIYLMIIEGSTAPSSYIPYGYKLPILSNSTVTNIYLGEVATTRRIKKLVLTGEENWSKNDTAISGATIFTRTINDGLTGYTPFCTHYAGSNSMTWASVPTNFVTVSIVSGGVQRLAINVGAAYSEITDFKAYLAAQYAAGTPVTVWYVLAEPKTDIVNEPLMKIGDYGDTVSMEQAGVSIPTNNGNTAIDHNGTLKPSQMYIKYNSWSGWSDIDNYKMVNGNWTQETT